MDPFQFSTQANLGANAQSNQAILAGGQMAQRGIMGGFATGAGVMQQNRSLDMQERESAIRRQQAEQQLATRRVLDEQLIRKSDIELRTLGAEIQMRQQLNALKLQDAQVNLETRRLEQEVQRRYGEPAAMLQLQKGLREIYYKDGQPIRYELTGNGGLREVPVDANDPMLQMRQAEVDNLRATTALREQQALGAATPGRQGPNASFMTAVQSRRQSLLEENFLTPAQYADGNTLGQMDKILTDEQRAALDRGERIYIGPKGKEDEIAKQLEKSDRAIEAMIEAAAGGFGEQPGQPAAQQQDDQIIPSEQFVSSIQSMVEGASMQKIGEMIRDVYNEAQSRGMPISQAQVMVLRRLASDPAMRAKLRDD